MPKQKSNKVVPKSIKTKSVTKPVPKLNAKNRKLLALVVAAVVLLIVLLVFLFNHHSEQF